MSTIANAYGNHLSSALPYFQSMPGIVTPYGTLLKPGGRIAAYVRSTGAQDGEDHFASSGMLVSTLNAGLARCRSGQGDIVYVLPGHTENVSAADFLSSLVAGTQIVSAGVPGASNNPTLTWSATTASVLFDVADVSLIGFNLDWGNVDSVDQAVTVSAAGALFAHNFVTLGKEAGATDTGCDAGILLDTGSHQARIIGNQFVNYGGTIAESAQSGSVIACGNAAGDNSRGIVIANNFISASTTGDTIGIIDVVGICPDLFVGHNFLIQRAADAAFAIIVASVSGTFGAVVNNKIRITENVAPTSAGVSIGASAVILLDDNRVSAANAAAAATHAADS